MRIHQRQWTPESGWRSTSGEPPGAADLVFCFGARRLISDRALLEEVRRDHPGAQIAGCSTAGEISGTAVDDNSLVTTAIRFDDTRIELRAFDLESDHDAAEAGSSLARQLASEDLAHVFVLSDGLHINGSSLVRGLFEVLPEGIQVTGGLAGDGEDFKETLVLMGGEARPRRVVAIGFYGSRLRIGYGSLGGWDPFGPERLVTRSEENVLYELDGRSALGLYKTYLGEYASGLPASALLFPLSLRIPGGETGVVRTVLAIDEKAGTMTFAGDLPEGCYARLMRANFERLIDGATFAARTSFDALGSTPPELALLISCVGRKMVLRQRIEEEVESVREVLGEETTLTGFYSYGEISPFTPFAKCELHNQTMTITTLSESTDSGGPQR